MPGGSRQVSLNLDLEDVVRGNQYYSQSKAGSYVYIFALIGCEVLLMLQDSSATGSKNLGVYFGLCKSTARAGQATNSIDAISCRAQIELWNPSEKNWPNLFRSNNILRYQAGGIAYGSDDGISLALFKQIVSPQDRGYGRSQAKFRVTITDIGLLELSNTEVLRPCGLLSARRDRKDGSTKQKGMRDP